MFNIMLIGLTLQDLRKHIFGKSSFNSQELQVEKLTVSFIYVYIFSKLM